MIDKNEDHLNDMQHVSFHNNIKQKLKLILYNLENQNENNLIIHVR